MKRILGIFFTSNGSLPLTAVCHCEGRREIVATGRALVAPVASNTRLLDDIGADLVLKRAAAMWHRLFFAEVG